MSFTFMFKLFTTNRANIINRLFDVSTILNIKVIFIKLSNMVKVTYNYFLASCRNFIIKINYISSQFAHRYINILLLEKFS